MYQGIPWLDTPCFHACHTSDSFHLLSQSTYYHKTTKVPVTAHKLALFFMIWLVDKYTAMIVIPSSLCRVKSWPPSNRVISLFRRNIKMRGRTLNRVRNAFHSLKQLVTHPKHDPLLNHQTSFFPFFVSWFVGQSDNSPQKERTFKLNQKSCLCDHCGAGEMGKKMRRAKLWMQTKNQPISSSGCPEKGIYLHSYVNASLSLIIVLNFQSISIISFLRTHSLASTYLFNWWQKSIMCSISASNSSTVLLLIFFPFLLLHNGHKDRFESFGSITN